MRIQLVNLWGGMSDWTISLLPMIVINKDGKLVELGLVLLTFGIVIEFGSNNINKEKKQ